MLRYDVTIAKAKDGFPIGHAKRLVGSTKEEIEADADNYLTDLPTAHALPVNLGVVGNNGAGDPMQALDQLLTAGFDGD